MTKIEEYILKSLSERQQHLKLDQACVERGTTGENLKDAYSSGRKSAWQYSVEKYGLAEASRMWKERASRGGRARRAG